MDEASKQYTAFTMGNLGCFECECMPFGLCNAQATFHRFMQNCLRELNLMHCLIYLDDVTVFSKMEEDHVQCLHVVFDHFWEHNLKLKPTKCKFFWNEINYLAHHVSKVGWDPAKRTWKLWQNSLCPKLTQKSESFWTWWGTTNNSSRGLDI